jgi:Domain of unknown function (DUF4412)
MKKSIFKIVTVIAVIIACSSMALAQSFEGTIEFKKATTIDTTNYVYTIKGNMVRIDEIGTKSRKIEGSFIVDLDAKTMTFLNHDRKLYGDQPTPAAPIIKGNCVVKKGQNVKNIQGYKCVEYIVTNTDENTQVTYYIADGKFSFFDKLLRQLNRKEKSSSYYLQIQNIKNMFPMLSFQTDIATGKETMKLEVSKITKKEVDASVFQVPKGYNKFEK